MKRRILSLLCRLGSVARWVILVILVVGGILHLGVRDKISFAAPLFYALPVSVLWAVAVVYVTLSIRRRIHFALAVIMLTGFGYRSFFAPIGMTEQKPNQPTLAFWNVDWGGVEESDFFDYLNETQAEIYVFAEFHENLQEVAQKGLIESRAKGYTVKLVGRGIAFVYRDHLIFEPLQAQETESYRFFRGRIGSRVIGVIDVASDPRLDRGPTMKALLKLTEGCDLVCGDFNTPYESIHFDDFREHFSCGLTSHFRGRETWPAPWPVLSLDHIFVNSSKTIVTYGTLDKWKTDHYPVAVKITD